WPKDAKLQSEVVQWLMFQMGGIGPMQGQANHFVCYAPKKVEYGIIRYTNETKRLFSVLESRLQDRQYLVGEQLTIADIATIPWIDNAFRVNIDLNEFPNVNAWNDRIETIPEVLRGYDVPTPNINKELKKDPEALKKHLAENAKWIIVANKQ
ncbi:glutathione S-transferase, partial [Conidiobolus coronatus NRRL 28638]